MEICPMPINPVIALQPAITFLPELAARTALARMANVREFSLTAMLNWMIIRNDEAIQQKLAHVDENDLSAYLDGRMSPQDFKLALAAYQDVKDQPPPKRRAKLKVVDQDTNGVTPAAESADGVRQAAPSEAA
jgi:hypothetical protein